MKTYFLQYGLRDGTKACSLSNERGYFLDDVMHREAVLEDTVKANSWLEAREIVADTHYM